MLESDPTAFWPERTIKFFATQIFLGLEYLHYCQIIRRDVKPDNVVVFEDGSLKITDFGTSRTLVGRATTFPGTKQYMSPQLLRQKDSGKSADWWAFGMTLFVLFFHDFAYWPPNQRGISPTDEMLEAPLVFPTTPEISDSARDLITKLLEKNDSKRLGGMEEGKPGYERVKSHEGFDIDCLRVFDKKFRINVDFQGPLPVTIYDINNVTHDRKDNLGRFGKHFPEF